MRSIKYEKPITGRGDIKGSDVITKDISENRSIRGRA